MVKYYYTRQYDEKELITQESRNDIEKICSIISNHIYQQHFNVFNKDITKEHNFAFKIWCKRIIFNKCLANDNAQYAINDALTHPENVSILLHNAD